MKKTVDPEKLRRREMMDALQRASTLLCQGGLPAFPKPHIRPIGNGGYACKRHVIHDEFMTGFGDSAKSAYAAAHGLETGSDFAIAPVSFPTWWAGQE